MEMDTWGERSTRSATARALRLILALSNDDEDAFVATLDEVGESLDDLRGLVGGLAAFGSSRVKRSPCPDRWQRWLVERIAEELDAAEAADA